MLYFIDSDRRKFGLLPPISSNKMQTFNWNNSISKYPYKTDELLQNKSTLHKIENLGLPRRAGKYGCQNTDV